MSFPQLIRRCRDQSKPDGVRWAAFRRAVASYGRLTRQSVRETWTRLNAVHGDDFVSAARTLEIERTIFIARLRLFFCKRCESKRHSRRPPSIYDLAALYRPDFCVSGDQFETPRAYMFSRYGPPGLRLVKQPIECQSTIMRRIQEYVIGPFTADEWIEYFTMTNSNRGYAWPFSEAAIREFLAATDRVELPANRPTS